MNKADCFNLGYVAKLHGFKGEVSLFFDVTNPNDYASLDAVFIDLNGLLTPFFVENIKLNNKGFARVKFEGVNSENEAKVLLRKELFLPLSILPSLGDKNFYDHEIVGFEVVDELEGNCGVVKEVLDYKVNPLIQLTFNDKEILLPLIDGLVQKVDRKNKKLYVSAPQGLIQLYLGN